MNSLKIQSIQWLGDSVQLTYMEDADIDRDSGVAEVHVLDIPLPILDREGLTEELTDIVVQMLEAVRVARRRPVDSFVAER